jgi:hypothetical protein
MNTKKMIINRKKFVFITLCMIKTKVVMALKPLRIETIPIRKYIINGESVLIDYIYLPK